VGACLIPDLRWWDGFFTLLDGQTGIMGFSGVGTPLAEFRKAVGETKNQFFHSNYLKFLKIWFNNSILFLTIMSILLKIQQNPKAFRPIVRRCELQECTSPGSHLRL
jgi:hypothetical protein